MTTANNPPSDIPPSGRLLGVDYGTKRIGLALATPDRTFASPLETYERRNEQLDTRYYRSIIEDYRPCGIIIGLPIHVNGEESQKSREARQYGQWLHQITGLPVSYWDERFTSAAAEDYLLDADLSRQQRKKRIDKVAAQIILQAYLDANRPTPERTPDDDDFDDFM